MAFSGNKNQLLQRIKRILNQPQKSTDMIEKIIGTGLLILVMMGSIAMNTKEDIPNINETEISKVRKAIFITSLVKDLVQVSTELDTFPDAKRKVKKAGKERSIRIVKENDAIKKLEIDGEHIAPSDYHKYQAEINELNIAPVPPPLPPVPFIYPAAPIYPLPPPPPTAPKPKKNLKKLLGYMENMPDIKWSNELMMAFQGMDSEQPMIIYHNLEGEDSEVIVTVENGEKIVIQIQGDEPIVIEGHSLEPGDTMIIMETYSGEGNNLASLYADAVYDISLDNLFFRKEQLLHEYHTQNEVELKRNIEEARHLFEKAKYLNLEAPRAMSWYSVGTSSFSSQIEAQLFKDGFIAKGQPYSFKLTDKYIKVNGKKLSSAHHNKYKQLYKDFYGKEMKKKSKVEIKT